MTKIKKYLLTAMAIMVILPIAHGQAKVDSSYVNWYYNERFDLFEQLNGQKCDIVFVGNSITERGEWQELIPSKVVANRGIGGDNTFGVKARLAQVVSLQPKKVFILIGINDIGRGLPIEVIVANYSAIIRELKNKLPKTAIYVQSVLPLNDEILKYDYLKNKKPLIDELNLKINALAKDEKLIYVNLNVVFADNEGRLKSDFTMDGIHLTPVAYTHWVRYLNTKKYL
jgi:lysophospholipase L1-like esterase